jgi:tetratricopeptide (TPR) repeat protein
VENDDVSESVRTGPLRERASLEDEEGFLKSSLEDLDREHSAGEIDSTDYEELRKHYLARAAVVTAALNDLADKPTPTRRPATSRRWMSLGRHRAIIGWAAAVSFAVAGTLLGLALAGVAPFASSTPQLSTAARIQLELGEAAVLANGGHVLQAVAVYDKVLELDPNQPQALADSGWIVRLAGLSSKNSSLVTGGDKEIAAAVKASLGYALARAYDGVALFEDKHSASSAVDQFNALLADHASPTLIASVRAQAAAAYRAAGVAVPRQFGGG